MKYKFKCCEKLKFAVVMLLLALPIQNANAQMIDSNNDDNDNWLYFYDIAIEKGSYISMSSENDFVSDAKIISILGSYFWTDKFGFRSGFSYIDGIYGSERYCKVPLLFSFRTRTFRWLLFDDEIESLQETLLKLLLLIVPTRFELNIGPSFGYITPNKYVHYTTARGNKVLSQTADLRSRFASSIDANARLSFQFWRICLNGNIGFNYLLTNNFDYRIHHPYKEKVNSSWFVNVSAGLSFRF